MAVVDVIDLTVSPPLPSINIIDDAVEKPVPYGTEDSKSKKHRDRRNDERERDRRQQRWEEDQRHDKPLDEDRHRHGQKRKRDHANGTSSTQRRRERSPTPPLFLIETFPGPSSSVPHPIDPAIEPPPEPPDEPPAPGGLLLPSHVTVYTHEPAFLPSEDPRLSPSSEASGIDFLDDDRAVGAPRYFHEAKSARSRGPCTVCGDDDHDFKTCPNMICITCGARNEHGSRSCPILRFCWNCKAKGHIAKDCPRIGSMDPRELNRQDCERCGSWKHHGTNCPSLWRIYTYLTDAEREAVLVGRESKRQLAFDNGGEGYIARDHWCYNCGKSGHLGDDCDVAPNHDRPNEYSAFGSFNELCGPFASPSSADPKFDRPPRAWEEGDKFDDGYGFSADNNVGKKGRENAKAKAREAQRRLEDDNDEPDWFNMNRAGTIDEKAKAADPVSRGRAGLPPKPPPTIRFGASISKSSLDSGNGKRPPTAPVALRDRIDMGDQRSTEYSHRDRDRGDMRGRDGRREEESRRRESDQRRDRGYYSSRDDPYRDRGSRWRGGYER